MDEPVRADRWLWAARLVKTRPLAVEAIDGGRVHVNGQRIKPSRAIRPGDRLEITIGVVRRSLVVLATAQRRGPASAAALLYEETAESLAARERQAQARRLAGPDDAAGPRPTKRDRRRLESGPGSHRRR